jgi:hypothetical protein
MSQELFEKWLPRAKEIEPKALDVPLSVLLDEAPVVAAFVRNRWEPKDGPDDKHPGLKSAVKARPMAIAWSVELADEILELQAATQYGQNQYVLAATPQDPPPTDRAEFVVSELSAVLEWYFDDGVEDEHDAQLSALDASVGEPSTIAELASALEGYAAVAATVRGEIDGVIGFEVALIDEAPTLARQLRERDVPKDPTAMAEALDARRRLATLLHERLQLVRRAGRAVFRHQPELAREPISAYRRRRRAARRRAEAAAKAAEGSAS